MPTTNPADIHDTETCHCEQCVWASQQEQEMVANDIDAVLEQVARPRDFAAVMNQWTEVCVVAAQSAQGASDALAITRLGMLGQQLLTEANTIGLSEAARLMREKR